MKRILGVFLTAAMLSGLWPAWGMTATAASTSSSESTDMAMSVEYKRTVAPEVAILNKYTGNSKEFYTRIKNGEMGNLYNAVERLFGRETNVSHSNNGWEMAPNSVKSELNEYDIAKLLEVPNNLEANVSGTFYNNAHLHSKGNTGTYVHAYEILSLSVTENHVVTAAGSVDAYSDKVRAGDGVFKPIVYNSAVASDKNQANDMTVSIRHSLNGYTINSRYYECSCGGTEVDDIVIAFRDSKTPVLKSLSFSTNGTDWTANNAKNAYRAVAGDTLYIKLSYDEPLRFANDSATDMNKLYILLQKQGESDGSGNKAYLYKLDGNDLYFKYTVQDTDATRDIIRINASTFCGTDIPLIQLCNAKLNGLTVATVTDGIDGDYGFTKSRCYVTDIAGNPLYVNNGTDSTADISGVNLVLDTEAPCVKEVIFGGATNNAKIKSTLTVDGVPKDKLTVGSEVYEKYYTDTSDTYLGVGDTLSVTLRMNERVKLDLVRNDMGTLLNWYWGVATTNIKAPSGFSETLNVGVDEDGYITLRTSRMTPYTYGENSSEPTQFKLTDLVITEGMEVNDDAGRILITKFEFDFDPNNAYGSYAYKDLLDENRYATDLAGNAINQNSLTIEESANKNPYCLDAIAPVVSSNGGATENGDGFRYDFSIGIDTAAGEKKTASGTYENCSAYEDIYGNFILTNGGDGCNYKYQYAVKASTESTVSESDWKDAVIGVSVPFTQTSDVYLYVRPKAGESYFDLRECVLIISAEDYAGNVKTESLSVDGDDFTWYIDNIAPTAEAGSITRKLSGDADGSGLLTAGIKLQDVHGISEWYYAWTDTDSAPTTESDVWTKGALGTQTDDKTVTVQTTPQTIEGDSTFSKYLWVKATDNATDNATKNNKSEAIGLGQYSYDLTDAKYGLEYDTDFQTRASTKITSLDDDDALIFMIAAKDVTSNDKATGMYVLAVKKSDFSEDMDIFGQSYAGNWARYTDVTKQDNGQYTFSTTISDMGLGKIASGKYSGNLTVTVLSGKAAPLSLSEQNYDRTESETVKKILSAGDDSYTFKSETYTLKVTSDDPAANYCHTSEGAQDVSYITLGGPDGLTSYISETYRSTWLKNMAENWDKSKELLSTFEGVELTIAIPQDNNKWECKDIDRRNSKIVLTNQTTGTAYNVPLQTFTVTTNDNNKTKATQTVTIPAASALSDDKNAAYTTGVYKIELQLYFTADADKSNRSVLTVPYKDANDNVAEIVLDATEPDENFSIETVGYDVSSLYNTFGNDPYNVFAMDTVYDDRAYTVGNDNVLYLPVSGGDVFGPDGYDTDNQNKFYTENVNNTQYDITISSPTEKEPVLLDSKMYTGATASWTGLYLIRMWREGAEKKVVTWIPGENEGDAQKLTNLSGGFSVYNKDMDGLIYLEPDKENKVIIEKAYANGRTAQTSVTIKPVTQQLNGTLSIDSQSSELVFTPSDEDLAFTDAQVFAFVYSNDVDWKRVKDTDKDKYELIPMSLSAKGGWRCALAENGANYRVFTVNAYGSAWTSKDAYVSDRAPYFDSTTFTDNQNGTYTLKTQVYDDLKSITANSPEITVAFDENYSNETFTFSISDLTEDTSKHQTYTWTTGNSASATGIYAVTVQKSYVNWASVSDEEKADYLDVTIEGVFLPRGKDLSDMGLTLTAVDAMGYIGRKTVAATPNYQAPTVTVHELDKEGLKLTFSQPIMPVESWAWVEADDDYSNKGYKTEWTGAFPIIANGTYDIALRDVMGSTQAIANVDLSDAFTKGGKDWSITLTQSQTALTREAFSMTAALKNPYDDVDGLHLIKSGIVGSSRDTILIPQGYYNGTETVETASSFDINGGRFYQSYFAWNEYNYVATSQTRTVTIEENGEYEVRAYDVRYSELVEMSGTTNNYVFRQTVYVNNIAKAAPEATVKYFVKSDGNIYTYDELEAFTGSGKTVVGNVIVTYKTSRNVTATDEYDGQFTFTPENYEQYKDGITFTYTDDMGNEGTAEAKLPSGLTLVNSTSTSTTTDTAVPLVNVNVYTKRYDSYTHEESFTARKDTTSLTTETFTDLGYVQGYRLVLKITDESDYTVSISEADGVSLNGNILTVSKASPFTVTVTDTANNATAFTVTEAMLGKIDTTAPTGTVTENKATDLYSKVLTIDLSDDNGGDVTLSLPLDASKTTTPNRYQYKATTNGTVTFVFYDHVGNCGTASYTVSGLDTTPPELTVIWSPTGTKDIYNQETGKTETVIDQTIPPTDFVNTDVTALIDSDKALSALQLVIHDDSENPIALLSDGAATNNPYVIADPNKPSEALVEIKAFPERILVTYHDAYYGKLLFTATAPNGQSKEITLNASLNIDKTAPTIKSAITGLYRKDENKNDYSKPYAVEAVFEADEWVISPNYGAIETVNGEKGYKKYLDSDSNAALKLTFTANGTYAIQFVDLAGNVTIENVTITDIDRTAPIITVTDRDESGNRVTVNVATDEDTTLTVNKKSYNLTKDTKQEIVFDENGSYLVTATDLAGNKSYQTITVGTIDKILPSIRFDTNTIYVLQNSDENALSEKLRAGVNVSDNITDVDTLKRSMTIGSESEKVDLAKSGVYTVPYTVTDEAGNKATAERFVQVIGNNTVCIQIDGKFVLPGSTAVLAPGEHRLTLLNNGDEPYSIKARRGIYGVGQMKYLSASSLSFDEDGTFTVTDNGYYTLLVTTQSRQTIGIRLYIER